MKKKLLVIAIIACLSLSGCVALKTFFCEKDSATEMSRAQIYLQKAQETLAILQTLPVSLEVIAAIAAVKLAIATLSRVVDEVCKSVTPEQYAQAVQTIESQNLNALQMQKRYQLERGK